MRKVDPTLKNDLSLEGKIKQLERAGWEIKQEGNGYLCRYPMSLTSNNAKYLYSVRCASKKDIVHRLFYASVGTQHQLADEFGVTNVGLSYIVAGKRSGDRLPNKDLILFYLSQITERPYEITKKKLAEKNTDSIKQDLTTALNALSDIAGSNYRAEYFKGSVKEQSSITITCNGLPVFCSQPANYGEVHSFIMNCLQIEHNDFNDDFDFIQSVLDL